MRPKPPLLRRGLFCASAIGSIVRSDAVAWGSFIEPRILELKRQVAVKVLSEAASPEARERLIYSGSWFMS